jgi:hypothetical protein
MPSAGGREIVKRTWVAFLMLASAAVSPALGAGPLASTILLALHAGDHEHSASLVGDGRHQHLVLSHAESGGLANVAELPGEAEHQSAGSGDHVLEIAADHTASASARRPTLSHAPGISPPLPFASIPALRRPSPPTVQVRAPSFAPQRTIVLRL